MKTICLLIVSYLLGLGTLAAQNSNMALDFEGEGNNGFHANLTLGWSFEVNHPVKVEALAFFDHFESDEDGLTFEHQVRIWTDSETPVLQVAATITNNSTPVDSMAANGRWLANEISTVVLMPGTYIIGADDPSCNGSDCDRFRMVVTEFTMPEITFGEARSTSPPGPPLSPHPNLNAGYFGPSFMADAVLLGDVNGDSVVDLLDVTPFVNTIADGTYLVEADINLDGSVDLLDVQLFVNLLIGD